VVTILVRTCSFALKEMKRLPGWTGCQKIERARHRLVYLIYFDLEFMAFDAQICSNH
jgi:hypothetical protein